MSEEPEEGAKVSKDTEMYEKIIDEMDVDQNQPNEELDEDVLLADNNEQQQLQQGEAAEKKEQRNGQDSTNTEQMEVTDGSDKSNEDRGVKRRAESPSKEPTPKKKQRLPPPNCDDFVNEEDEPELDENLLQLSWCKFRKFPLKELFF